MPSLEWDCASNREIEKIASLKSTENMCADLLGAQKS